MLKLASLTALFIFTGAALAQSTQPGQTTPSVTPSDTPAVTPSQTPPIATPPIATPPSATPPTQPPVIGAPTVGGMSQCQNMIGGDRDKCLQDEQRPNRGAAAMGSQNPAPAGAVR